MTIAFISRPARKVRSYVPTGAVGQHLSAARSLQLQIQELTALYDKERTWLLQHMQDKALTNVALGDVKCVLKSRARWSYSLETQRDMEAMQITQKWEQSRGIASNDPSFYVALTEAK